MLQRFNSVLVNVPEAFNQEIKVPEQQSAGHDDRGRRFLFITCRDLITPASCPRVVKDQPLYLFKVFSVASGKRTAVGQSRCRYERVFGRCGEAGTASSGYNLGIAVRTIFIKRQASSGELVVKHLRSPFTYKKREIA
nr:hypothetical protein [Geomonas azotofigens]